MCVKNFFGILVVLTSVFCVSCVPVKTQKPKPQPKQGFLVRGSLGVSSAKQLDGASVCLIEGSKEEKLVSDYFKKNSMKYESVTLANNQEILRGHRGKRFDVMVIFSNANINNHHKFLPLE